MDLAPATSIAPSAAQEPVKASAPSLPPPALSVGVTGTEGGPAVLGHLPTQGPTAGDEARQHEQSGASPSAPEGIATPQTAAASAPSPSLSPPPPPLPASSTAPPPVPSLGNNPPVQPLPALVSLPQSSPASASSSASPSPAAARVAAVRARAQAHVEATMLTRRSSSAASTQSDSATRSLGGLPSTSPPAYTALPLPLPSPQAPTAASNVGEAPTPGAIGFLAPAPEPNDDERGGLAEASKSSLPIFVGALPAVGEELAQLQGAMASMGGCGVVLTVTNYTTQMLTLKECAVSQGKWRLPPPAGIAPRSLSCFAVYGPHDVSGRATYVDAHRHHYVLDWVRPAATATDGGTVATVALPPPRGSVDCSCTPDRLSVADGYTPFKTSSRMVSPPVQHHAGGVPVELAWTIQ